MIGWDAVGALAELLGAVGVIATLIFLARQIQQNTVAVKASTNHALTVQRNDLNVQFGLDAGATDLLLRGSQNIDGLDFNERYRYSLLMRAVLGICEDTFIQHSEGMCGVEQWESSKIVLGPIVAAPSFVDWWCKNREIMLPTFREEVDRLMTTQRETR